jgi:hypothetical protein
MLFYNSKANLEVILNWLFYVTNNIIFIKAKGLTMYHYISRTSEGFCGMVLCFYFLLLSKSGTFIIGKIKEFKCVSFQ